MFDIDMTDYDEVRVCCSYASWYLTLLLAHHSRSGANICSKCWALMTVAIKVVDRVLRGKLGFIAFAIV